MQQMNIRANPKLNEFGKCVYSIGEHLSAFVLYPEVYTSVKGKSVKKWRGGGGKCSLPLGGAGFNPLKPNE
jgi:hypothetical protein